MSFRGILKYFHFKLFLTLLSVGLGTLLLSILILFFGTVDEVRNRAKEKIDLYAHLIDAVAEHDKRYERILGHKDPKQATLLQIYNAMTDKQGKGVPGSYELGELKGGEVNFLVLPGIQLDETHKVKIKDRSRSPMWRALNGKIGVMYVRDYKGDWVIAAYHYVPSINIGIVSKAKISEVSKPFIDAIVKGSVLVIILSLILACIYSLLLAAIRLPKFTPLRGYIKAYSNTSIFISTFTSFFIMIIFILWYSFSTVYPVDFQRQVKELNFMAGEIASLINSVAKYDKQHQLSRANISNQEIMLSQIKEAIKYFDGYKDTGEFLLAKKENDQIVFLLSTRFGHGKPQAVPFDGTLAEPMRKALSGERGVSLESIDYLGETVVAAYVPIPDLNIGLVLKLDLQEIQEPYYIASYVIISFALLFVVLATLMSTNYLGYILPNISRKLFSLGESSSETDNEDMLSKKSILLIALIAGVTAVTLTLDIMMPLGMGSGIPYIVALVLAAWLMDNRGVIFMGGVMTLLVILGAIFSPPGDEEISSAIVTRAYGIFVIWFIVVILYKSKRTESSLKQRETMLLSFIDNLPEAIIVCNKKSVICKANKEFEKLFGYGEEDVIGQHINVIRTKNDIRIDKDIPKEYFEHPHVIHREHNDELFLKKKNGEELPIELSLSPIILEKDVYVAASIRDYTEKARVRRYLLDAKKHAEEAAQSKSSFLANMSHEIRTPMNAIIGMATLALDSDLNDKQRNYIEKLLLSADLLLNIINDILDFSKLEAGAIELEHINFQLGDVLENFNNIVGLKAKEKELDLIVDVHKDVPINYIGDPWRLSQLLINLGGNAVKFTKEGYVKLGIEVEKSEKGKVILQFTISDSGIGISKEQQRKLFQAFSQADSSITRQYGGSGLGLSICQQILELMGGNIWVESELGEGSKFYFTVGLETVEMTAQSAQASTKEKADVTIHLDGAHILVVEDNEINKELLVELLQKYKVHVDVASNGKQAIDKIKNNSYDIVLMDCFMPVMDGLEATKVIRQSQCYDSLPIIAITASVTNEDRAKIFSVGMNDFVAKPIRVKELYSVISKWLNPEKVSGECHELKEIPPTQSMPEFKALDMQSGLEVCNGDMDLYMRLLNKFVDSYQDFQQSFNQLLSRNDFTNAKIQAHSLKGAAANIGASALQQTAAKLELSCKDEIDTDDIEHYFRQVEKELARLTKELREYLSHESVEQEIVNADSLHELHEKFVSFKQLLKDNDAKAVQAFDDIATHKCFHQHRELIEKIQQRLSHYDFEQALIDCESLESLIKET